MDPRKTRQPVSEPPVPSPAAEEERASTAAINEGLHQILISTETAHEQVSESESEVEFVRDEIPFEEDPALSALKNTVSKLRTLPAIGQHSAADSFFGVPTPPTTTPTTHVPPSPPIITPIAPVSLHPHRLQLPHVQWY